VQGYLHGRESQKAFVGTTTKTLYGKMCECLERGQQGMFVNQELAVIPLATEEIQISGGALSKVQGKAVMGSDRSVSLPPPLAF